MLHRDVTKKQAGARALELMKAVGIPRADRRIGDYPHQFSGGMRQRVMIAMALINDPDLLIADEPTTALDVTTQAQILELMKRLQQEFDSAIIMITHDLGVVAEVADDVLVMYAGERRREGPVARSSTRRTIPTRGACSGRCRGSTTTPSRLTQIPGQPPSLLRPPSGCRFHPRCPYVMDVCSSEFPELKPVPATPTTRSGAGSTRRRSAARPRSCWRARWPGRRDG